MSLMAWGLLGPEKLAMERRTRTLALGATVRAFNDLAVPGLGGAWFGKQLFLATLGVAVAERVRNVGRRVRNIEVANAVEALGCWLALTANDWPRDARLRGATKMRRATDLSFGNMRRRTFYVTQPMRQATVQPLRALGLVESAGERFNAFACTQPGQDFIDAVCEGCYPYNRTVLDHLTGWATGAHDNVKHSTPLTEALSPVQPMPQAARELLRERVVQGTSAEAARRRAALDWMEAMRATLDQQVIWDTRPPMLSEDHWQDLHAGSLFFAARDAAIALLDQIEAHIANESAQKLSLDGPLPGAILTSVQILQQHGQVFLDNRHDPSPGLMASAFCRECTDRQPARLLEQLLRREGRVLRQSGRDILPGVAFRGGQKVRSEAARSTEEEGAEANAERELPFPDGISHRVSNLFLLNLDLRGELDSWLGAPGDDGDDTQ